MINANTDTDIYKLNLMSGEEKRQKREAVRKDIVRMERRIKELQWYNIF